MATGAGTGQCKTHTATECTRAISDVLICLCNLSVNDSKGRETLHPGTGVHFHSYTFLYLIRVRHYCHCPNMLYIASRVETAIK